MHLSALLPLAALILAANAAPGGTGDYCTNWCKDTTGLSGDDVLVAPFTSGVTIDNYCYCKFSAGSCKKLCKKLGEAHDYPFAGYCRPEEDQYTCGCYVPVGTPGSTPSDGKCEGKGSYKPPRAGHQQ